MYFKQIELTQFPNFDLTRIKGDLLFTAGIRKNETGIVKSYCLNDHDYTIKILKKLFEFGVDPNWIGYVEIEGVGAPPHIDHHKTGLNLIIDDADAVTCFWRKKETEEHEIIGNFEELEIATKVEDKDVSKFYDINKCYKVSEFKAKNNSAWLYNLREIHSVHRTNDNRIRKFISLRWHEEYDIVENFITIL
jgi:hypothetical protein